MDKPSENITASKNRAMFAEIARRYDLTNSVLSFGIHHLWRGILFGAMDQHNKPGSQELAIDICAGTGDLVPGLGARFARVIAIDACLPMLQVGQSRMTSPDTIASAASDTSKTSPITFVQGDALCLPFERNKADAVTIAYGVRNLTNPLLGLKEIHRVLKPGCYLYVLEFGQPDNRLLKKAYGLYSKYVLPIIGGILTGKPSAYRYLNQTSLAFPCGKAFETLLREAGLRVEKTRALFGGIAWLYVAKKED